MKTGSIAAAGLALAVAAASNAAMIVNTFEDGAGSNAHPANSTLHLMQRVTFDEAFTLNSIAVRAAGNSFNLFLATNIGEDADDDFDIMWSATDVEAESGFSWITLDAGGAEVAAGEYYLIMTSDADGGARWNRVFSNVEGTTGVGFAGLATDNLDTITEKTFTSDLSGRVYGTRIDGDVIPAPGAAALFGLAGLTAARRRR